MLSNEKLRKDHKESDSDEEDELEVIPQIDINVTKLSVLSPKVISKQVSTNHVQICSLILKGISRLP
jgi:translation initiation factor 2 subunit 3